MIPNIETKSPDEIKKLQETHLQNLMSYLHKNSKFYKRHFIAHQIDYSKILQLEDLLKIPPTTKDDLQKLNWDFLCVAKDKIAEYTSTSGTMGKPVTIALTSNDLERLAYNEFISLSCADGVAGDLYQLMLTLDRQFMAGLAYHEGIRKMGAGAIRVGPGLPASQWDSIVNLQPTILIAVPSFILRLIDWAKQHGLSPNDTSVKRIVCIGENIRTADFQLNTLGQKIVANWNVKLYSTYASTEMQTAFTECNHGRGGHHHPELIITEVLNDQGVPVANGEVGELTITTLGVEGMPLLRYKTGDMVALHHESCACGRTTARVSPVLGRQQQMIKLKGTTIYPPGIFELLHESNISGYVVEVFSNELDTDELRLFVHGDDSTARQLATLFQSRLRVTPEIILTSLQEIERMQFADGGRKPRKFIDRRL